MSGTAGTRGLRILVAVDRTDASERAAAIAHRLFGDTAEYLLLNVATDTGDTVVPLGDPLLPGSAPEPRLAAPDPAQADLLDTVAHHAHLDHPAELSGTGDVAAVVVQAAHDQGADVIVVGAHDRSWFARLFDPSVSRHVVGAADRPVLVVRDHPVPPGGPQRRVLVATDASPTARRAARAAASLFGAAVNYEVVCVAPERPDPNADATGFAGPLIDDAQADALERQGLEWAAAAAAATAADIAAAVGGVEVTETVLEGDTAHTLDEYARSSGADVLVVGSHGETGPMRVLLGSVSTAVVAHCPLPVLVVRS